MKGVITLVAGPVLTYLGLFWIFLPWAFYLVGGFRGVRYGFVIAVGATALLALYFVVPAAAWLFYFGLRRVGVGEVPATLLTAIFCVVALPGGLLLLVLNFGGDFSNLFLFFVSSP